MDLHQVKLKNNHLMFFTCIYYLLSRVLTIIFWENVSTNLYGSTQHWWFEIVFSQTKTKTKKSAREDIVKLPLPHLTYDVSHTRVRTWLVWSFLIHFLLLQKNTKWLELRMLLSLNSPFFPCEWFLPHTYRA
jgi:hypothetical protein